MQIHSRSFVNLSDLLGDLTGRDRGGDELSLLSWFQEFADVSWGDSNHVLIQASKVRNELDFVEDLTAFDERIDSLPEKDSTFVDVAH